MDQNLPSNSHFSKREAEKPKQITRVVQGEVVSRKPSIGKRFKETMFAGRADTVGEYVINDVLIPAAKDTIADMVTSFVDRMIFGDRAGARVRGRGMSNVIGQSIGMIGNGGINNQTAYNRIGQSGPLGTTIAQQPLGAIREIIIPTRPEAEAVIAQLLFTIQEYNAVTVSDYYSMCGITGNYTDDKRGWQDIRGTEVARAPGGGYFLTLPRPIELD